MTTTPLPATSSAARRALDAGRAAPARASAGFTLVELMIVVAIIAIISAVAIPSLLNSRIAGNEASAISTLRDLRNVQVQYRMRNGAYPSALTDLQTAGYVNGFVFVGANIHKAGYVFTYTAVGIERWAVAAQPINPGVTGYRYFFVDDSGVIRFSTTGAATSVSPAID